MHELPVCLVWYEVYTDNFTKFFTIYGYYYAKGAKWAEWEAFSRTLATSEVSTSLAATSSNEAKKAK